MDRNDSDFPRSDPKKAAFVLPNDPKIASGKLSAYGDPEMNQDFFPHFSHVIPLPYRIQESALIASLIGIPSR